MHVEDESQYNSQETFHLGEPIILEEADMLFRYVAIDNYNHNYNIICCIILHLLHYLLLHNKFELNSFVL